MYLHGFKLKCQGFLPQSNQMRMRDTEPNIAYRYTARVKLPRMWEIVLLCSMWIWNNSVQSGKHFSLCVARRVLVKVRASLLPYVMERGAVSARWVSWSLFESFACHALRLSCGPFRASCLHNKVSQRVKLDCWSRATLNHCPWPQRDHKIPNWMPQNSRYTN